MVSRTPKNALVGAVVSVVLFFLPFSPALGGAAAGYLQRGGATEGAKVGALSGAVAAIPGTLLAVLIAGAFLIAPADGGLRLLAIVVLVSFLAVGLYGVAFGAAGGAIGAYLASYFDRERVIERGRGTDGDRIAADASRADGPR